MFAGMDSVMSRQAADLSARRVALRLAWLLAALFFAPPPAGAQDWPVYGGDAGGTRYSAAALVTRDTVSRLAPAWTYHTGDRWPSGRQGASFEDTPILADGRLLVCTPTDRVIALDPLTGIASAVSGDTLLRKRFAIIEKAREAKSIGIIVSTKGGQARMGLAQRLAALSPNAVIVTMKEVSPDELLNLGFAAYVNTACPRLAYDDQIRFPAPVLSPQEFEILCGARTWDEYQIDEIP
jgi:hypothetical protein